MTDDPRRLASELAIQKFELLVQTAALADQVADFAQQVAIYDATTCALIVVDESARIHLVNAAAVRLLGVSREALVKGRIDAFVAARSLPEVLPMLHAAVEGTPMRRFLELDLGRRVDVLIDAVALPGSSGADARCLLTVVDVSGIIG